MMQIVIDMQGAQTESRYRGIGRYTLSFVEAVCRLEGDHEIILALSGLFPETIEPIRAHFETLLPQDRIRVWHAQGPVREAHPGNENRRQCAELVREQFLASLEPDLIHVSSLFEGAGDDAVTSIGILDSRIPVSVSLYDLIPLLNPEQYLTPHPRFEAFYDRKINYLKRASCCLAISEHSRTEAVEHLDLNPDKVVNISTAASGHFRVLDHKREIESAVRARFNIDRPYVLYTGGADDRKNLPRLISAYARLSRKLRSSHRLVFAGKIDEQNVDYLKNCARQSGLADRELRLTGYVSDGELVELYNACRLYVFPSWHEGFGLPALEAMACGAPVVGSNISSLPEVIGNQDALFDPFDVASICSKISLALGDAGFRDQLREHGLRQSKRFSWEHIAREALDAWQKISGATEAGHGVQVTSNQEFFKALAEPSSEIEQAELLGLSTDIARNEQSGFQRQLLVDVSELSQHDSATGVQRVVRGYLTWLLHSPPDGFRVEPVYATVAGKYRYARRFTQRFLNLGDCDAEDDLIWWQRGDIYFGLDMQHHVQLNHQSFYRKLRQHGVSVKFIVYDLLPIEFPDYFYDPGLPDLHARLMDLIGTTDGAICISGATSKALQHWIESRHNSPTIGFQNTWVHIGADLEGSVPSKGMPTEAPQVLQALRARETFLCVATLEPRKMQQQVLEAVEQLWRRGVDVNLVLVGGEGWRMGELADRLRNHSEFKQRLFWLTGISDEYLERIYGESTCLIAASVNEGFGLPVIEAAQQGTPVIARDIPVFREVAGSNAHYFSGETAKELASALQEWLALYESGKHPLPDGLKWSTWEESTERLKGVLIGNRYPRHQLLVDVSELVHHDAGTGIQRVVKSVLREWLNEPPERYRVEPVYATLDKGYRYGRAFTQRLMGLQDNPVADDPIDFAPGDIFFGLDLQPQVQSAQAGFYQCLRRQGVRVEFLVHDLLCSQRPDWFPSVTAKGFGHWLETVAECDGAICVTRSVAQDLMRWLKEQPTSRKRAFRVGWSHNGADIGVTEQEPSANPNEDSVVDCLQRGSTFLMVGTVEPRKGHSQVLDAFDTLWAEGLQINLAIVGKEGWGNKDLIRRLRRHPKRGSRLFWLEGISDRYLTKLYDASTCLIAASHGEGFGLPLIEAAKHELPIVARDIPVFREVAGHCAYYFCGTRGSELARVIKDWMKLYEGNNHPTSGGITWLTWKESAKNLLDLLIGSEEQRSCGATHGILAKERTAQSADSAIDNVKELLR